MLCLSFTLSIAVVSVSAASVSWTGQGGNTAWETTANWSGNALPGANDDVVIAGTSTLTIRVNANANIRSLQCAANLTVKSGTLTLTAGSSVVQGMLDLAGGALVVQGTGTTFTATGPTTLEGADLETEGGAQLSLPNLHAIAKADDSDTHLSAWDSDSVISLPALSQVQLPANDSLAAYAYNGGRVQLPALSSLKASWDIYTEGNGSVVDLSGWTGEFGDPAFGLSKVEARSGSTILLPSVTSMVATRLIVRGSGQTPVGQLTSLRNGELRLDGVTNTLPGLTDVLGTDLTLQNGAKLTLAGVTQLVETNSTALTLSVSDPGSVLSLPNLTSATLVAGNDLRLYVYSGGQILVPRLFTQGTMDVYADGEGGLVDLSGWTGTLQGTPSSRTYLEARTGATIQIPNVTALDRVRLILRNTGKIPVAQITSFHNGEFRLEAATNSLPGLVDLLGTDVTLQSGA